MKPLPLILALLAITAEAARADYSVDVRLDKADGYYKLGEEAVCTVTLLNDGKPAVGEKLRCTVKQEREIVRREEFACTGKPLEIRASMDRPGWLYLGFDIIGPDDLTPLNLYEPVGRGFEAKIAERLAYWDSLRRERAKQD